MVIDTAGTVKDNYDYYAFGEALDQTISTGQSYRYTGKPFDNDRSLNLHYSGARYYDGTTGRFPSFDPLSVEYPEWSPYVYCGQNPLNMVDPTGLEWYEVTEEYTVREYYKDANGDTQARMVTKQRKVWKWYANTPSMMLWNGSYDENGNKVMELVEGLTDEQLRLSIFLEEAMDKFGVKDIISIAVWIFGQPFVNKAFQWVGATKGTSPLAIALRKLAPWAVLPRGCVAPAGWPEMLGGRGVRLASTRGVGAFAARWAPYVAIAILAYSSGATVYGSIDRYNRVLKSREDANDGAGGGSSWGNFEPTSWGGSW